MKKAKKLKDFPRYNYNPTAFPNKIMGLRIGGINETVLKQYVEGDELVSEHYEGKYRVRIYDSKEFVKLYSSCYCDLINLTSSGVSVFAYILTSLRYMQEHMTIRDDVFGEWYKSLTGCSDGNASMVCYRGIIDLLTNELIFLKTGDSSFYININKFFKGKAEKIKWVKAIDDRLERKEIVKKVEFAYDENYIPTSEEIEKYYGN